MTKLFEEFKELETARQEIRESLSNLERILDIEKEIFLLYNLHFRGKSHTENGNEELYDFILKYTSSKIPKPSIHPSIIQKYIEARDNPEINFQDGVVRGMYSGALLEIVCSQTEEPVIVDGKGKTFHFLFNHVRNAKNVSIKNFRGYLILSNAGRAGTVTNLSVEGIVGDCLLYRAAGDKGNCEQLSIKNVYGTETLKSAGFNYGKLAFLDLHNISGGYTLSNSEGHYGYLSHVTISKLKNSESALFGLGSDAKVEHIHLSQVKSKNLLERAVVRKGILNYATFRNITGKDLLLAAGNQEGLISHIAFQDTHDVRILFNTEKEEGKVEHVLREPAYSARQKRIFDTIDALALNMHTLSPPEQKKKHLEIAELQKELFAEEK